LDDAVLASVAAAAAVTPARALLRWSLQKGYVPLPKSVHAARQAENLDVFSFALSDEQMAALDSLERGLVTGWDPITQDAV
jgi:2,5-diketo-D-gluconate reductase A